MRHLGGLSTRATTIATRLGMLDRRLQSGEHSKRIQNPYRRVSKMGRTEYGYITLQPQPPAGTKC